MRKVIFFSSVLFMAGCAASPAETHPTTQTASHRLTATSFVGGWQYSAGGGTQTFVDLALRKDGTWIALTLGDDGVTTSRASGTYAASGDGDSATLVLTSTVDPTSGATTTASFTAGLDDGGNLFLWADGDSSNDQLLAPQPSWCEAASDCAGQFTRPNVAMCMMGASVKTQCVAGACVAHCAAQSDLDRDLAQQTGWNKSALTGLPAQPLDADTLGALASLVTRCVQQNVTTAANGTKVQDPSTSICPELVFSAGPDASARERADFALVGTGFTAVGWDAADSDQGDLSDIGIYDATGARVAVYHSVMDFEDLLEGLRRVSSRP